VRRAVGRPRQPFKLGVVRVDLAERWQARHGGGGLRIVIALEALGAVVRVFLHTKREFLAAGIGNR